MCNRKFHCVVIKTSLWAILLQHITMPRLTDTQRNQAIGMLRSMSVNEVAQFFNCHRTTISKLKSRVQRTGSVKDMPRTGRPRVTSAADDRLIQTTHLRNRFKTASSTAREWPGDLSRKTVSRRLKAVGLLCRRPAKKSRLIDRHKRARLTWATRYRRYTQRQWSDVVFSDESSFPIQKLDMRERVYRRVGERFADACLRREQDRRSVMVWGGISIRGKTELIICHRNIDADYYQNQIMTPGLLPFLENLPNRRNIQFMHDGCSVHTARITQAFYKQITLTLWCPGLPKVQI